MQALGGPGRKARRIEGNLAIGISFSFPRERLLTCSGFLQRLSLVERTLYVSYTVPAQYQVQYTADKMSVQTLRQIVSAPQLWSICSLLFLHLKVQKGFVCLRVDATTLLHLATLLCTYPTPGTNDASHLGTARHKTS